MSDETAQSKTTNHGALYAKFLKRVGLDSDPDASAWAAAHEKAFFDLIEEARQDGFRQAIAECAAAHELTAKKPGFDTEWHMKAAALMRSVGERDD